MDERDDFGVRDRVEDLISSIVGLEHIKCQVRNVKTSLVQFILTQAKLTWGLFFGT